MVARPASGWSASTFRKVRWSSEAVSVRCTATTEAERVPPSIAASSPTEPPGPMSSNATSRPLAA